MSLKIEGLSEELESKNEILKNIKTTLENELTKITNEFEFSQTQTQKLQEQEILNWQESQRIQARL